MNGELKTAKEELNSDIDNIKELYNKEMKDCKTSDNCFACGYNYICNGMHCDDGSQIS